MRYLVILPALILLTPISAVCDGFDEPDSFQDQSAGQPQSDPPQNASNASFDRRLPPVIPGETLPDGAGGTKVWSTGGSPVGSGVAPVPPQAPSAPSIPGENDGLDSSLPPNLGIIIDQSGRRGR